MATTDHFSGFSIMASALANPSTNTKSVILPSTALPTYTLPIVLASSTLDISGVGRWSYFDLTMNWNSPQLLQLSFRPDFGNHPNVGDCLVAGLFTGSPSPSNLVSDFGPGVPAYPYADSVFTFKYTSNAPNNSVVRVGYFNVGLNDVPGFLAYAFKAG